MQTGRMIARFQEQASVVVSARYWRILATGDTWYAAYPRYISAYTIKGFMSADASGNDIFQGKSVSASSIYSSSYLASYAVDGLESTRWLSDRNSTEYQWFQVDLGAAVAVRSLSINGYWSVSIDRRMWPRTFDVLASSDGTTWTTVASLSSENVSGYETWTDLQ